jgi:hypothetical protein
MGILSDFEDRLARAVEGAFAGAFRSPVQPAELARALSHAMDDGKVAGVGKVYAPSSFTVELSGEDARKLGQTFEGVLSKELSTYLLDHARKRDYSLAAGPTVEFATSRALKLGRFRIAANMAVPPEGPEAGAADATVTPQRPAAAKPSEPTPVAVDAGADIGAEPASQPAAPPAAEPTPEPARVPENIEAAAAAASAVAAAHEPAEAPAGPPKLATVTVGEDGHDVALHGDRVEVGRLSDCGIQLDDHNVSRRHAALVATAGGWAVEDLGSTNGTFLNGTRTQRAVLADGDTVTVGATRLAYHAGR